MAFATLPVVARRATFDDPVVAIARRDLGGATAFAAMGPADLTRLTPLVYANRLQGLLLHDLEQIGADGVLVDELRAWSDRRVTTHIAVLADLRRIASALEATGIDMMALKGPVLTECVYRDPSLRPYGDIDLLVAAEDFEAAVETLEGVGCDLIDANWELILSERRSQLHLRTPFGNMVDLHWHLMNRGSVRESFSIPIDPIFDRRVGVDVGGFAVDTMSPEDTIVHVATNAALGGGRRLSASVDLRYLIERSSPAWNEVVTRAQVWRVGPLVWLSLLRARRLADAPVPEDVVAALQPGRAQRAITARVERRWPYSPATSEAGLAEVWSSSLRSASAGTGRALGGRSVRWAQNRVARSPDVLEPSRRSDEGRAGYFRSLARAEETGSPR